MNKIVSLTNAGKVLAEQLAVKLSAKNAHSVEVHFKPQPFTEFVQRSFQQGDRLILICATGIAVRTLAPVLSSKLKDPAVLVLDELGQFVIPMLSGHEGGANDWGRQVAELLDAQLIMTTAKPYLSPVYGVGMGCERGCSLEDLELLLMKSLRQANLELAQITHISSISIKADELGLIALAKKLNKPFLTWPKEDLKEVESLLSTKSDYIYSVVGVYGVAESAALYDVHKLTGQEGELVLTKQKSATATCAIARAYPNAG